ncbi:DgyrCDS13421 [Dimorphilus gyrociliatus]|uniref:MICOS complex subunit MIC13 n=1 Tax=Dimorphilus gyrociliatus TaxID=2664684 RepID=A0A7I8WAL6_9ANNE|nr:DgyrCDS13421 [Dimorphilus gyrociliatus]
MALTIARVGAKLAIGGGALYYTLDKGVWSTNTDASKLIDEVQNAVLEDTKAYIRTMPSPNETSEKLKGYWNSNVESGFRVVANAPEVVTAKTTEYSKKAVAEIAKSLKP